MRINSITIRKKHVEIRTILIVIAFCFLIVPSYITYLNYKPLSYLIKIGRYAVIAYIGANYLMRGKVSKLFFLEACICAVIVVSTFFNGGDVSSSFASALIALSFIMLVENEYGHIKALWSAFIIYLSLIVIVNLATIIIHPTGLYSTYKVFGGKLYLEERHWFLGFKNGIGKYCLFLLFFVADKNFNENGSLTYYFYFVGAISLITVVLIQSVMSFVVISLFLAGVLCARRIKDKEYTFFNIYYMVMIYIVLFVIIIVFQRFSIFESIINLTGKNATTFGGRSIIWENAIKLITKKPLLGYGDISGDEFRDLLGKTNASDAHNFILTLAIKGGVIAVSLYIVLLIIVINNISKYQYSYTGIVLSLFTILFLVLLIIENTSNNIYLSIFSYSSVCFNGKQNIRYLQQKKKRIFDRKRITIRLR